MEIYPASSLAARNSFAAALTSSDFTAIVLESTLGPKCNAAFFASYCELHQCPFLVGKTTEADLASEIQPGLPRNRGNSSRAEMGSSTEKRGQTINRKTGPY
jgi:hypothetical protein